LLVIFVLDSGGLGGPISCALGRYAFNQLVV